MATLEYASMPTDLTEVQVRQVAARQRALIYCILGYFAVVVALLAAPQSVKPFVGLGFLAVIVVAAISVYRLAAKFYHPVMAVLMVIAMVLPLIGLIVLLTINGKATSLLRANNVWVGFLGARV